MLTMYKAEPPGETVTILATRLRLHLRADRRKEPRDRQKRMKLAIPRQPMAKTVWMISLPRRRPRKRAIGCLERCLEYGSLLESDLLFLCLLRGFVLYDTTPGNNSTMSIHQHCSSSRALAWYVLAITSACNVYRHSGEASAN
jgi:hypothetical protein